MVKDNTKDYFVTKQEVLTLLKPLGAESKIFKKSFVNLNFLLAFNL